jgi:hypothetical protein
MSMVVVGEVLSVLDPEQGDEDIEQTGTIIWNYYKTVGAQSKSGGAKNIRCTLGDCAFTGCSPTRAIAHILGGPVLGQK